VFDWVSEVEQRGAGEILLQSVDVDGRCRGFDTELASKVVGLVNIPVVASSGAGSLKDIKTLIEVANPSGVAIASLLHYDRLTIQDIKSYLRSNGISVIL
jgi:cyclase